jgi:outer membrane lipoprotein carrier protein
MQLQLNKLFVLLCFYSLLNTLQAAEAEALEARALVENFLTSAERVSARFSQRLTDENGSVLEETTGQFWLQRPGQFRWQYAAPMERVLVSDGQQIWLHDVELDQVTIRSANGVLEQTPAGILVGNVDTLDNYILSIRNRSADGVAVGLVPVSTRSDFQDIVLGLKDGQLRSLNLADRFGQLTEIDFSEQTLNPQIDSARFTFIVPPGVDVINQTVSSAN